MDHLQKFITQTRNRLLALLILNNVVVLTAWWLLSHHSGLQVVLQEYEVMAIVVVGALLVTILLAWLGARHLTKPVTSIWQAVLHIAPDTGNVKAPDLNKIHFGRELITALTSHIYQLASVAEDIEKTASAKRPDLSADFVANSLPLPLAVLDKDMNVLFANQALLDYTARTADETLGQNVYLVLDMMFSDQHTFDSWLERVRNNQVTAVQAWERVKLNLPENKQTKSFDLVAYYNKSNPDGFEIILTLFDRTRQYAQDEQAMSFLALAVHELRTPLTLLRGYLDVFEEELNGKLDPTLTDYLNKMKATAQQLSSFIGTVLNVARFENDQLVLKLHEEQWTSLLQSAIRDIDLRARVHGITFSVTIDENLPPVGADAPGIYEVINNLLDNAIKYSKENSQIVIRSYLTSNGLVETTVQDFGVGIPEAAMGNLFGKFYRDYRNRTQVGGTGMGLYLSKAIITAHGGNIWVRSKPGNGSTFGFTLIPYAQLEESKKSGKAGIVRTAHGWIKNHSLYRR